MTRDILLTITSLLSIVLMTFHISDEIARGSEIGGLNMVIPLTIVAAWLYGTLLLAGRRAGYVIMLIVAIFGTGIPILHMSSTNGLIGGKIAADSSGAFFWAWQNIALCCISIFSLVVCARALWDPKWAKARLLPND